MTIRIIKHEAVPQTGSFEVRYDDGQPSRYFYFEDVPSRRLRSEQMTMEQALEAAKAFARSERDKPQVRLPRPRSVAGTSAVNKTRNAAPRPIMLARATLVTYWSPEIPPAADYLRRKRQIQITGP
jgi:hypothetical protein